MWRKNFWTFTKFCNICLSFNVTYNNGNAKITNWLGNADNESLKFATGKWYVINDQNNTDYGDEDENGTTITFETKVIKWNLCNY